jgi:hypothetical protein
MLKLTTTSHLIRHPFCPLLFSLPPADRSSSFFNAIMAILLDLKEPNGEGKQQNDHLWLRNHRRAKIMNSIVGARFMRCSCEPACEHDERDRHFPLDDHVPVHENLLSERTRQRPDNPTFMKIMIGSLSHRKRFNQLPYRVIMNLIVDLMC